ncbi:GPN-loop GTPase 3 [Leptinotarsa decemlineata]|uniref:GPN-loop GTPase 3 n=1 Tax=Leptinotarsa decemlineata TaxID=7539 RepID=UPI003D30BA5E
MRYAQLVIGPAGCGKSTYCHTLVQHGVEIKRNIKVVNLDPAAEHFQYNPLVDIRELIQVQDTMEDEDLQFGPNGGLVFCIEYLLENSDWLRDKIGDQDEDYILFDCPGQIELYMHLTAMKKLAKQLQDWEFSICCVYIIDVQFMTDPFKFISGAMSALSVMVNLELPHVNILSKMDLLSKSAKKRLESFLEPDSHMLLRDFDLSTDVGFSKKYQNFTETIGTILNDYSLVRFIPFNRKSHENISDVLIAIDYIIQYGEDLDVKTQDFVEQEEDD